MKKILIYGFALIYGLSLYLIFHEIPEVVLEWVLLGGFTISYGAVFLLSYHVVNFFNEIIENNFIDNNQFSINFYLVFIPVASIRLIGLFLNNSDILTWDFIIFGNLYSFVTLLLIFIIGVIKANTDLKWILILSIPMVIYIGFDLMTIQELWRV